MVFIYILSDQSGDNLKPSNYPWLEVLTEWLHKLYFDKVVHLILYLILGILLARGLLLKPIYLIAIGSLYGVSDEFHQRFVPGRNFDLFDLLFDVIGCTIGVYFYIKKYRKG